MPHSRSSIFIPLPPEEVYRRAKDVQGLARYLPGAERITPLELTPTRTVHKMEARTAGRKISYIEVEEWNDATLANSFHSPEGDFDKYQGRYLFTPAEGGTQFEMELEWELNIPLIGALLKNLIARFVQENVDAVAVAMKKMCLDGAPARG